MKKKMVKRACKLLACIVVVFFFTISVPVETKCSWKPILILESIVSVEKTHVETTCHSSSNIYATGGWLRKANMPTSVCNAGVAVINNEIFIMGGTGDIRKANVYHTDNNTWSNLNSMPVYLNMVVAGAINGKIYAVANNGASNFYEYNPGNNTWTPKASTPTIVNYGCGGVVNNTFYFVDGLNAHLYVYDPVSNAWATKTSMPAPVARWMSACSVYNGKLYIFGGWNGFSVKNDTSVYDPVSDTWETKKPMSYKRSNAVAATVGNRIFVLGGKNGNSVDANEEYDPVNDTWKTALPLLNRNMAAMSAAVGDRIYLIGGQIDVSSVNYNQQFSPKITPTTPSSPMNVILSGDDQNVIVSWTPPISNGGSEISNYRVYRGTVTGDTHLIQTIGWQTTSCMNYGLSLYVDYYYNITAINAAGEGASSAETHIKLTPKTGLKTYNYQSSIDNHTMQFKEYLPTDYNKATKWPLVLFLHGAGGNMSQYVNNTDVCSVLENRGYIGAFVNGRMANSNYFNSVDYGPGENDTLDIITYLKAIRNIDDNRIYLTGRSMGGGSAWSLAARNPSIFAATAPHVGVTDWAQYFMYNDWYGNEYLIHVYGGKYDKNSSVASKYKEDSGRFLIENMMNIPVFITQGDNDTNVPNNVTTWPYMNAYHVVDNASYVDGNGHTPTLHELEARFPGKYIEQHIWSYGKNHSYFPDFNLTFDFFDKYQKNMSVNQVFYKTYDAVHTSAYWVDIRINKPLQNSPGYINATYETSNQTIMVETLNATRIGINLNHLPFDIANPVNIKTRPAATSQTNAGMVVWGPFFKYGSGNTEVIMDYTQLQEGKDFTVYNDRIVINNFTMDGWHTFTIMPKTPINEIVVVVCLLFTVCLLVLMSRRNKLYG